MNYTHSIDLLLIYFSNILSKTVEPSKTTQLNKMLELNEQYSTKSCAFFALKIKVELGHMSPKAWCL